MERQFRFCLLLTWPQANPIPASPIPCGQLKFNSKASEPASHACRVNSVQSGSLNPHIMLATIICWHETKNPCSGRYFIVVWRATIFFFTHVLREIALKLANRTQPVRGRLFGDQLDVQKSRVLWTPETTGTSRIATGHGDSRWNVGHAVLVQSERLGHGERPAREERPANHGRTGCRWGGRQTKRIQKLQATHPYR